MTECARLQEISQSLQAGLVKAVKLLVQQAIEEGVPAQEILSGGLLRGMREIGEKFKRQEIFVPEVLVAARSMSLGMAQLRPLLRGPQGRPLGRACIGTVQGDLHDIGKNLVRMTLESRGLEVIDLGVDVPPEVFVRTARERRCGIICCSALLTTTMGAMEEVVRAAVSAGIRRDVRIMIGGAPVTEVFCRQIGADAYTPDALSAAECAASYCN